MDKRRILLTGAILIFLILLFYFQFRDWSAFNWPAFWAEAREIRLGHILHAVLLIYFGYLLRATRWKILLRPVRPNASLIGLVPPTLIGFTGLALLGRLGELIRPYLIARRENLPFSSQLAVWAVERIFDIGAFAILLAVAIFLPGTLAADAHPEFRGGLITGGILLLGFVVALALGATLVSYKGEALAAGFERRFSHLSENLGHRLAQKIREFRAGLNTIESPLALILLIAVSLLMWYVIALAYQEVTISYHDVTLATYAANGTKNPLDLPVLRILLLMGSSMVGSMVQLPGVGGGSQVATIATLERIFDVPRELALSCGVMLWLVTFVAVVPVGLLLAHREHLSLRRLSKESHEAPPSESTAQAET